MFLPFHTLKNVPWFRRLRLMNVSAEQRTIIKTSALGFYSFVWSHKCFRIWLFSSPRSAKHRMTVVPRVLSKWFDVQPKSWLFLSSHSFPWGHIWLFLTSNLPTHFHSLRKMLLTGVSVQEWTIINTFVWPYWSRKCPGIDFSRFQDPSKASYDSHGYHQSVSKCCMCSEVVASLFCLMLFHLWTQLASFLTFTSPFPHTQENALCLRRPMHRNEQSQNHSARIIPFCVTLGIP